MPRTKGGVVSRRRRNKVLKLAKGYFGSKHALYKTAHEQVMNSGEYTLKKAILISAMMKTEFFSTKTKPN